MHLTRWQLVKLLSRKEKERERYSEKAQSFFFCLPLVCVSSCVRDVFQKKKQTKNNTDNNISLFRKFRQVENGTSNDITASYPYKKQKKLSFCVFGPFQIIPP